MTTDSPLSDFSIGKVIPDNLRLSVLQAILPAMHDGYIFQDKDGVIQGYNQAACRILRMTPDQLMGKTSLDPDWRPIREDGSPFPGELHPITVTLNTGTPCYGVVLGIQTKEGAPRWLQVNSQAVFDETGETMIGAVALFSDITQEVSIKKALEKQHASADAEEIAARIRLQKVLVELSGPAQSVVETVEAIKDEIARRSPSEDLANRILVLEEAGGQIMALVSALEAANASES